jgi:hypothetical protein
LSVRIKKLAISLDYPLEVGVVAAVLGVAAQHLLNCLREDAVYSLLCYQKPIGTFLKFLLWGGLSFIKQA